MGIAITRLSNGNVKIQVDSNKPKYITDMRVVITPSDDNLTFSITDSKGNVTTYKAADISTINGVAAPVGADNICDTLSSGVFFLTSSSSSGAATQAETKDYQSRVSAAGGNISALSIGALDRFVARGKSFGWLSKCKECWIPLGDFAASKIKLISTTSWTFNNLVSSDYSEESGYVVTGNSNKYIATGFIPNSNGLTSQNVSLAIATTEAVSPTNFGRLVGVDSGTGDSIYVSNKEGNFSVGGATLQNSFARQAATFVGTWGASVFRGFLNGTFQLEKASAVSGMAEQINIFRSWRGSTMYYADGSIGFYWIGQDLTQAEAQDLNLAMMDLMRSTRTIYKKVPAITIGDSITAGSGGSFYDPDGVPTAWPYLFCKMIGAREQSNAQGSSRLTTNDSSSGAIAMINRYTPTLQMPSFCVPIVAGTNDMSTSVDSTTNGDSTLANTYSNNLTQMVVAYSKWGHRVVLGSVPYRTDTNDAKHTLYVTKAAGVAKSKRTAFADLYHAFTDQTTPSSFLADGVHPNDAGHKLVAEYMYEAWLGRLVRKPTLDFGSIAAGASAELTVTVYNAVVGMSVSLGLPAALEAGLVATAYVSADDTVKVRLNNTTGVAIDPVAAQYKVTVFTSY